MIIIAALGLAGIAALFLRQTVGQAEPPPPRPYMGAVVGTIKPSSRGGEIQLADGRTIYVPTTAGIYLVNVTRNSPADQAGLRKGDIITALNGKAYSDSAKLVEQLQRFSPGQSVQLNVLRDQKENEITVILGAMQEGQPFDRSMSAYEAKKEIIQALETANENQRKAIFIGDWGFAYKDFKGNEPADHYGANLSFTVNFYLLPPRRIRESWVVDLGPAGAPIAWKEPGEAGQFAAAVNRMIWEESPEVSARHEAEFKNVIAAWQANGSKVALPDEALRHKVLAVHAFEQKDFQRAVDEYEAALQIYPTWPDGQYVCAAIEGQLKDYDDAIPHMKAYLELVPDAPNAEKAKEQIWIWQDEQKSISK